MLMEVVRPRRSSKPFINLPSIRSIISYQKISFEVMVALPILPSEIGGINERQQFHPAVGASGFCRQLRHRRCRRDDPRRGWVMLRVDHERGDVTVVESAASADLPRQRIQHVASAGGTQSFLSAFSRRDQQAISGDTFNCVKQMKEFGVDHTMTPLIYTNEVRRMGLNRSMSMALAPAVAMSCRSAGPSAAAMAPRSASRLCASLRWRRPRFSITDKVT